MSTIFPAFTFFLWRLPDLRVFNIKFSPDMTKPVFNTTIKLPSGTHHANGLHMDQVSKFMVYNKQLHLFCSFSPQLPLHQNAQESLNTPQVIIPGTTDHETISKPPPPRIGKLQSLQ